MDPFPVGALRLNIGPVTLAPGAEQTMCVIGSLPTTVPIDVVQIDARLTFSHHIIFYRESPDTPENLTPTPCPPLDLFSQSRSPLFIGETSEATMRLPAGVVYRLAAGGRYRIEGHFLNASPMPEQANAEVILSPAPPGSANQEADMIFLNAVTPLEQNYDGVQTGLPPMKTTTVTPAFYAVPPELLGSKFFALTSHQHHLGTDFTISKSTGAADPGTLLFENMDWQHPALLIYPDNAPLSFQAGEGFRWLCTYNNTTTSYVHFGQSAVDNEMCIVWAYYYPSQGFQSILQ